MAIYGVIESYNPFYTIRLGVVRGTQLRNEKISFLCFITDFSEMTG